MSSTLTTNQVSEGFNATSWAPYTRSLARIIFAFLLLRHGMEQVLGYPEASDAARMSLRGIVEVFTFPAALLLILGLFTRPVGKVLSIVYIALWFLDPLVATITRGQPIVGAPAPTDPMLLSALVFLYISAAGPGPWSLDYMRNPRSASIQSPWAPHLLGVLRIMAGLLFMPHGLEKMFGTRVLDPLRKVASVLEGFGGPLLALGIFTRITAFILSGEMAVAYFISWAPLGLWPSFRTFGQEMSILNSFLFLMLAASGPGKWSFDEFRARRRATVQTEPLKANVR